MYQVYKAQWLITRELGDVRLCHCAGIPAPRSSQIDPRRKDEFVAFVLFGVIQDGEGMGIVGGKGTPIPPLGPRRGDHFRSTAGTCGTASATRENVSRRC